MIKLAMGLKKSLMVLEYLRGEDQLQDLGVFVRSFMNGRECGLTFTVQKKDYTKSFTWCVYEHRNCDLIVVNGKENWEAANGELPYMADSDSLYLKGFAYNQYEECADYLAKEFLNYVNNKRGE